MRLVSGVLVALLLTACSLPGRAAPVTVSGSGTSHSAPFRLADGTYKVDWTLTSSATNSVAPCGHGARLTNANEERLGYPLGAGNVPRGEPTATGTTYAYGVTDGTYYLDVLANCAWSFVLTQQ